MADAADATDLLGGFVEDACDLYDAAAYVRAAGDVTVYRKRHLWVASARCSNPARTS